MSSVKPRLNRRLVLAALAHYLAYIFMQTLALMAELRRGPSLSDFLHRNIEATPELDWINIQGWFFGFLFSLLLLAVRYRKLAIDYLHLGAMISVLRGISVYLTTLGPPARVLERTPEFILNLKPEDLSWSLLFQQWLPLDLFGSPRQHSPVYLSQDMLFSGHTTSTFLFLFLFGFVYLKSEHRKPHWLDRPVLVWFIVFHIAIVMALILTHEHYSIDIFIAYIVVYAVWHFARMRGWLQIT